MRSYFAVVVDEAGNPKGLIPAESIRMDGLRLNQYQSPEFVFPKGMNKLGLLADYRNYLLYRGKDLLFSGQFGKKTLDENSKKITYKTSTYERLLKQMVVPHPVNINGMQLEDAYRYFLAGWKVFSVTTEEDFAETVEENGTDIDIESGNMYLTRTPGQKEVEGVTYNYLQFVSSGYRDFIHEMPDTVTEVERIYLSAKIGEAKDENENIAGTSIAFQYQTCRNGEWLEWSPVIGKNAPSKQGAEDGFVISGFENLSGPGNKIRIRIWLYTDNTTAPAEKWEDLDPIEDTNTLGITPEFMGYKLVCRTPGPVTEGSIPVTGITVDNFSIEGTSHYDIIRQLSIYYKKEFRVNHLKQLIVAQKFGITHEKPFIHGVNCSIEVIDEDPIPIRNVAYCFGSGTWPDQLFLEVRDDVSITKHGEYPFVHKDTSIDNIADLEAAGREKIVADPQLQVRMTFPGGPDNPFVFLGDTFRAIKREEKLDFEGRVAEWTCHASNQVEVYQVSVDTPAANLMNYIIKPKSLITNLNKASTPTNLRAVGGYGYIQVNWSSNGDYDIAQISHDISDPNNWRNTGGKITDQKLVLTQLPVESTMYIRVASVKDGKISTFTNPVNATTTQVPPEHIYRPTPPKPTIGEVTSQVYHPDGGITIVSNTVTWTNPSDNDKVNLVKVEQKELPDGLAVIYPTGPDSPWYDTGVKPGTGYQYRIQFVTDWGKVSEWSDYANVTTPTGTTTPAKPTGVTATPYFSRATLQCTPNTDPGLKGYEWAYSVYDSNDPTTVDPDNAQAFIPWRTNPVTFLGVYGLTYCIWVRAYTEVDNQTCYSPWSEMYILRLNKVGKTQMEIFENGILTPEVITDLLVAHQINVDGDRIRLGGGQGIKGYDPNNNVTFSLDPITGNSYFGGELKTRIVTSEIIDIQAVKFENIDSIYKEDTEVVGDVIGDTELTKTVTHPEMTRLVGSPYIKLPGRYQFEEIPHELKIPYNGSYYWAKVEKITTTGFTVIIKGDQWTHQPNFTFQWQRSGYNPDT